MAARYSVGVLEVAIQKGKQIPGSKSGTIESISNQETAGSDATTMGGKGQSHQAATPASDAHQ